MQYNTIVQFQNACHFEYIYCLKTRFRYCVPSTINKWNNELTNVLWDDLCLHDV